MDKHERWMAAIVEASKKWKGEPVSWSIKSLDSWDTEEKPDEHFEDNKDLFEI